MKLSFGTHQAEIPESWNELSLQQALECYNILSASPGSAFLPGEVLTSKRMALAIRLAGLTQEMLDAWKDDCWRAHGPQQGPIVMLEEAHHLMKITDFIFDVKPGKDEFSPTLYEIKLGLTKCPWPILEYTGKAGKKKRYYAPADGLENITLYELALTFALFERYLESNDTAHADELIATIYRPGKENTPENRRSGFQGDRRLPIYKHESMVKKRLPRLKVLPLDVKKLLLFWFASCREGIIQSYPNIFNKPGEMEIGGERVGNDYGWGGMLLALADGIVHLEQVSLQPYQNGLIYLSYLEDERKKAEMRRKREKVK
jgi:hypothetical protein